MIRLLQFYAYFFSLEIWKRIDYDIKVIFWFFISRVIIYNT